MNRLVQTGLSGLTGHSAHRPVEEDRSQGRETVCLIMREVPMILGALGNLMRQQCVMLTLVQPGQSGVTGQSVALLVGEECRSEPGTASCPGRG